MLSVRGLVADEMMGAWIDGMDMVPERPSSQLAVVVIGYITIEGMMDRSHSNCQHYH